jgi:hypothetical protein
MKETRRLDILAAIGGVLAVGWMGLAVAFLCNANQIVNTAEDRDYLRPVIIRRAGTPDLKADLEIMLPGIGEHDKKPDTGKIRQALDKYPDSPRLNLRLGTYGNEPLASQALRHMSDLDPRNALPLYLLASRAGSRASWDEASSLVKRANSLPKLEVYKLPYPLARGDIRLESCISQADSGMESLVSAIGKNAQDHALELHAVGRNDEALAILADARRVGWRLMRLDGVDAVDCLVGNKIVRNCSRAALRIAKDTNNQEALALATADMEKCSYIRAGFRAHADGLIDDMLKRLMKFMALAFSLCGLIFLSTSCLTGLAAHWSASRKSKGVPASSLHDEATASLLAGGRMLWRYALLIIACSASTAFLASMPYAPSPLSTAMVFAGVLVPFVLPAWMDAAVRKQYREVYNHLAEQRGVDMLPKKRRLAPIHDRREIDRRLAGLDGSFVITLSIWALLVCTLLRVEFHAYPWQITKTMGGMPQAEMKYVKDLVDGKVKVPQKYIDQVKREEARYNVQHPTSNAQRSRRNGVIR